MSNSRKSKRIAERDRVHPYCGVPGCQSSDSESETETDATFESATSELSESGDTTLNLQDQSVVIELLDFPFNNTVIRMEVSEQELNKMRRKLRNITADIIDHFDEHIIDSTFTVDDIEKQVSKVERLRSSYRDTYEELMEMIKDDEKMTDEYETHYGKIMMEIKQYISGGNDLTKDIRNEETRIRNEASFAKDKANGQVIAKKTQAADFLVKEVSRLVTDLNVEYIKTRHEVPDEELFRRNKEMSENSSKFESLSKKYQQFLETVPDTYTDRRNVTNAITESYEEVAERKSEYEKFVKEEMSTRELLKQAAFKSTNLNIDLKKYKGYDSDLDVFTFQSEFEKLYSKETPTNRLADLLKNKYLQNPALALVKRLENINEIWARLHKAYGDPRIMLRNKLTEVKSLGALNKIRDPDKLKDSLTAIINAMHDLLTLSTKFNIVQKLYHGEAFDMIQGMMGEPRLTKWLTSISEEQLDEEAKWSKLSEFFEKELRIQEEKGLIKSRSEVPNPASDNTPRDNRSPRGGGGGAHVVTPEDDAELRCSFCNEAGHVTTNGPNRTKLIQYYACKKFCDMNPTRRFQELSAKGFCFQCLFPGARKRDGRHATGACQNTYACKHESHAAHVNKKHVLVCQEHSEEEDNVRLLNEYKARFILPQRRAEQFSRDIRLSFVTQLYRNKPKIPNNQKLLQLKPNDEPPNTDSAIYILQHILVDGKVFLLFFDNGCSDFVTRQDAVKRLSSERCALEEEGPTKLGGVGDLTTESPYGKYQVRLPLASGKNCVLSGVCLEKITTTLPTYPLKGDIENDIHRAYESAGGEVQTLPALFQAVGGDVDFMVGSKFLRDHPNQIFKLPSGLTIYESPFLNPDGSRGVIGGPHPLITLIEGQHWAGKSFTTYFSEQYQVYRSGFQVNPDCYMLTSKPRNEFDICDEDGPSSYTTRQKLRNFEAAENAGSTIDYRCPDCHGCKKCKNSEQISRISMEGEAEQREIEKSVCVDLEAGKTTARLPLVHDPVLKLAPNKNQAMAIYKREVRKLSKNEQARKDVIKAERKLQDRGHVEYVRNLSPEMQHFLKTHPIQNFIPWHIVYNMNSITTDIRFVFNFSHATPSGYSVNDIVVKGRNNMNKLVEILIRWRTHKVAFHTDVEQMYPSIELDPAHWCLQRYVYQEELDPDSIAEEKVIIKVIYGSKSSGNQAEYALRKTTELCKDKYPEVNDIIHNDTYVDDCLSGAESDELGQLRANEMTIVLKKSGFNLKGFTFSGKPPPTHLSKDGESIKATGSRWISESDELQLDVGEVSFAKKKQGKKSASKDHLSVPKILTRSMCCGKVAEICDICGFMAPIIAHFKLDLRVIVNMNLKWEDAIPDNLRSIWVSHVEMIKEIGKVKFKRAVIPPDAVSLEVNTIDTGDASQEMACTAIYVRYLRKCGSYSCQLVFARTKLLPEGTTQPRAEMVAATLNTHTGEVVRRSLSKFHKSCVKLTDSKIVLFWINNRKIPLGQWVRSRVKEVYRFTNPDDWKHVSSSDMIADIGTRRGAKIEDVSADSPWQKGFPWMSKEVHEFPAMSYAEVKLSDEEKRNAEKEIVGFKGFPSNAFVSSPIPKEVLKERYEFSQYIIDPNKHRFRTVVRTLSFVMKFIKNCRTKAEIRRLKSTIPGSSADAMIKKLQSTTPAATVNDVTLTNDDLKSGANYYFKKATEEVKKFVKPERYENISTEKNGILYYTGRILPGQEFTSTVTLTGVMKDLTSSTFCVPLVDRHSPVAYSLVNEIHWHDNVAMHAGVETNLRYVLMYAYILEGRELIKTLKKCCERCRYLYKRTVEVAMGPISSSNLDIAPPFYICQIDLAGPFNAYSIHNKRATVKVWMCVFCCTTTTCVNIKLQEDYSTPAFLLAFIRLACEVGYPKIVMVDQGSQVVSGCENMKFDYRDAQNILNKEANVQLHTCPVGGHNYNGRVERKIQMIKGSIEKSVQNERLSVIQWETLCASIANSINDLPIAKGNQVADLEFADLITPNRLKLGRNNARCPDGPLLVTGKAEKIIRSNANIFNTWFESWLITCVPKLMEQPKWFVSNKDIQVGDIVLFLKKEGELCNTYQYGKVSAVQKGRDEKIRSVTVKYRNHNENTDRETERAVRELVVIHGVDELSIIAELGEVATMSDVMHKLELADEHC